MATPTVRRSSNKLAQPKQTRKTNPLSLSSRRVAAWVAEITLCAVSGLVPFGIGAYANTKTNMERVPLNPVLVAAERTIAYPLALPVSYGTRNVAWSTNFLWTIAILAPLSLSSWQWYLLAKTGSTTPKRLFGIKVVQNKNQPPGFRAVLLREGSRLALPISAAYMLWRYTLLFPNLGIFALLALLMSLAEAMGFPMLRQGRSIHDRVAGTYTVDATIPFDPALLRRKNKSMWAQGDEEAEIESIVVTPQNQKKDNLWVWMRQNPSLTLLGVALLSMAGVLITLVGTQIYIQTQENQKAIQQSNSRQFLTLEKQYYGNSRVNKQNTIVALGTLKDSQATKFLVGLLVKENDPSLVQSIQQALVSIGTQAIPELKRMNLLLERELDSLPSNKTRERELREKSLYANQQAINKILFVYNGKTNGIDLSRIQLSQNGEAKNSGFNLALDKVDLWGIDFKYANLDKASFTGSRFRGPGKDGRWDTYDDWIANLSQAQLKQANLSGANLSRVLMVRTNLSRSNLNKANLSAARLVGANLSSASLAKADLRNAVLENASLTGADLGEARLNDADLYGARLGRVVAIGTQLSNANLIKTEWQGADLSSAYLDRANLSNANLSAARLTGAILRSTNLQNVNLRNADLSLADLRGANLAGADFQGTILSARQQNPADKFVDTPTTGIQSAVVRGVDFSQVKNLDDNQKAYICTQGGFHNKYCP
ncbi:putative low-complexity protein [Rivularia sp. PCC 7116]|uniref:pentapeptide repeat-containing protein n=1 Tax=Rivularia sp. PCC 7116 TaxID=373994 RepID=UPI00029EC871|nr:pentapeptide repeat-containing protein [Rivularia sp. PCC 7116]AFY54929.1 putative low-complexity protein [Rivularia sp. PCC 7116]